MARAANQSDVAKAAGVAISTVSRALSNAPGISSELRQQIQGLARELGYEGRGLPVAEMRPVRTYITANVMTGGLVTFYSALLDSLRASALEAGLNLEIRLVRQALDPERLRDDFEASPVAASFLVGLDPSPEVLAMYGPDRPMVLVNTFDPEMRFDCVAPANFYGAMQATRQLLNAGHRRLMHLREQNRFTTDQREMGFLAAIAQVPGASGEVVESAPGGDARMAEIAALKASGKARWTGVYAVHDSAAIRLAHALEEVGLMVPRDVSLIGFDDLPAASMMTPRLSTMKVDTLSLGQQAVALLTRRMADPGAARLQVESSVETVAGETIAQISVG